MFRALLLVTLIVPLLSCGKDTAPASSDEAGPDANSSVCCLATCIDQKFATLQKTIDYPAIIFIDGDRHSDTCNGFEGAVLQTINSKSEVRIDLKPAEERASTYEILIHKLESCHVSNSTDPTETESIIVEIGQKISSKVNEVCCSTCSIEEYELAVVE